MRLLKHGFISLSLIAAVLFPAASFAATILKTDSFGSTEPGVAAFAGKPTGMSTPINGKNIPCVFTGTGGSYELNDNGDLDILQHTRCNDGTPNDGTSDIGWTMCSLTPTLACQPMPMFPNHYRVTAEGLYVNNQLHAWKGNKDAAQILSALSSSIAAHNTLKHAASPTASPAASPAASTTADKSIQCTGPSSHMTVPGLSGLNGMLQTPFGKHLDASAIATWCKDEYLAQAAVGSAIDKNSPIGKCLIAAGLSANLANGSCVVVGQ